MTLTLTPRKFTSDAPTGLTVASAGSLGALISWDPVNPGDKVEVWWNNTNNSGTATKIAETHDKTFLDEDFVKTDVGTHYYWLKRVEPNGNASGFTSSANTDIVYESAAWSSAAGQDVSIGDGTYGGWVYELKIPSGSPGDDFYVAKTTNGFKMIGKIRTDFEAVVASGEDLALSIKFETYNETISFSEGSVIFDNIWKQSYSKGIIYSTPWLMLNLTCGDNLTVGNEYSVKVYSKLVRTGSAYLSSGSFHISSDYLRITE